MNFLAHAILAGTKADVVAGSAAGDFVKGVLYDHQYPPDFLFGVRLHRRLDAFSNQNTNLRASADRLPKHLRRIGPPCIDMIADHFLARAARRSPQDYLPAIAGTEPAMATLEAYEDGVHQSLVNHWRLLSPQAQRFFTHARTSRLFSNYADFGRVSRGIGYVCERLGRNADATTMISAIEAQLSALEADFGDYWPALMAESQRFREVRQP